MSRPLHLWACSASMRSTFRPTGSRSIKSPTFFQTGVIASMMFTLFPFVVFSLISCAILGFMSVQFEYKIHSREEQIPRFQHMRACNEAPSTFMYLPGVMPPYPLGLHISKDGWLPSECRISEGNMQMLKQHGICNFNLFGNAAVMYVTYLR